jgi:hypothetical protein
MAGELMRTWHFELAAVVAILAGTVIVTGAPPIEWVAAGGVAASFAHGQVSDRLAAKEAARTVPEVDCHRWSRRYFVAKEILWLSYFIARGAWAALVGCGVFLAYPVWRAWWTRTNAPRAK